MSTALSRLSALVVLLVCSSVIAGEPAAHFIHAGALPPGEIGYRRLQRGGPIHGFYQPVEIRVPQGATLSHAANGAFTDSVAGPFKASLLVGPVYRLQVTNIPNYEGLEVYPTVEIIDRLYSPVGYQKKFPIEVEITQEEIEMALDGKFVTRVIYLEHPDIALPVNQKPGEQSVFEVQPGDDPLEVADTLGRPAAILRMGGLLPTSDGPDAAFMYGSPPVMASALEEPANLPRVEAAPIAVQKAGAIEPEKIPALPRDDMPQEGGPPGMMPGACCDPYAGPPYGMGGNRPLRRGLQTPWKPDGIACPWPHDEWIHDGGDKNVHVNLTNEPAVRGLDLEDTVVHADDVNGCLLVEPSNRVHIYAPRFLAVRQVTVANINQGAEKAYGDVLNERLALHLEKQPPLVAALPLHPLDDTGVKGPRISRFADPPIPLRNRVMPAEMRDEIMPYENFAIIRLGIAELKQQPLVEKRVQAAIAWTVNQAVQVIIDTKQAVVVNGDQRAQATFGLKEPQCPRLRVVKIASTQLARSGDIVDFTIRYDNTGDQELKNVTLLDNLTTRLEYVEGSAQSSREAEFNTQTNEGQSLVLRWDFTQTLPVGEGGLVRFKCRVR